MRSFLKRVVCWGSFVRRFYRLQFVSKFSRMRSDKRKKLSYYVRTIVQWAKSNLEKLSFISAHFRSLLRVFIWAETWPSFDRLFCGLEGQQQAAHARPWQKSLFFVSEALRRYKRLKVLQKNDKKDTTRKAFVNERNVQRSIHETYVQLVHNFPKRTLWSLSATKLGIHNQKHFRMLWGHIDLHVLHVLDDKKRNYNLR